MSIPYILLAILLIIITAFIILLPVMIRDGSRFVTREYVISSSKIAKEHTFVFLSDLHEKIYEPDNQPIIDSIRKIDPELVIIGGDMITGATADPENNAWAENALSLFERIHSEYPMWVCNGNHEQKIEDPLYEKRFGDSYRRYEKALGKIGIKVHRNEHEPLPGDPSVVLWNFEPEHCAFRKFHDHHVSVSYIKERIGEAPDSRCFNLVISHHPLHFDPAAQWGADLVLAGHIHGGIMRLPVIGGAVSPDPALLPHYSGGRYELTLDNTGRILKRTGRVYNEKKRPEIPEGGRRAVMVLSCGIGFHTIPIRIFNPAEISVVKLMPEKQR